MDWSSWPRRAAGRRPVTGAGRSARSSSWSPGWRRAGRPSDSSASRSSSCARTASSASTLIDTSRKSRSATRHRSARASRSSRPVGPYLLPLRRLDRAEPGQLGHVHPQRPALGEEPGLEVAEQVLRRLRRPPATAASAAAVELGLARHGEDPPVAGPVLLEAHLHVAGLRRRHPERRHLRAPAGPQLHGAVPVVVAGLGADPDRPVRRPAAAATAPRWCPRRTRSAGCCRPRAPARPSHRARRRPRCSP